MYIAINNRLFRESPVRALRFAIRRETLMDILLDVEKGNNRIDEFTILYVE